MPTFVPEVRLWLGDEWVQVVGDSSRDVLARDGVNLTRGRADWSAQVQPSRATMSLKNALGKYSPRHPGSPYFGLLGRNTPIKVLMDGRCRFHGEVSEWPPRADPDVHVPIEAGGVLRRLTAPDSDPLRSVLYRTMMSEGDLPLPTAYWPAEEQDDVRYLYSAIARNRHVLVPSTVRLAGSSDLVASAPIPVLNNTQIYADVSPYPVSTTTTGFCVVKLPDGGLAQDNTPVMVVNSAGTARYWRVRVNINGTLNLQVAAPDGSTITTTSNTSFGVAAEGAMILLELTTAAPNVTWQLKVLNVGRTSASVTSGTVTSRTYSLIKRLTFSSNENVGDTAVGHFGVWRGTVDTTVLLDALKGHAGETAGNRLRRLSREEELPFVFTGNLDDTQRMGPQRVKSLTELLTECADVDAGILYEPMETARVIGDFEDGTVQDWSGGGASPPTMVNSAVRAHTGTRSLEITWPGGSSDQIAHVPQPEMYVVGFTYTLSAWVYVPSGSSHAALAVGGVGFGPSTSVFNTWQHLEYTFVCTATDNEAQLWAQTPSVAGGKVYVDDVQVSSVRPGIAYRTRASLYNTTPSLTLDFDQQQVAPPFEPTEDDQLLANDVTVTREGGASFRQEVTTGSLSVAAVGRRRASGTYNVQLDDDALQLTGWQAHLGTWDEMRVAQLAVSLTRHSSLAAAACLVDSGHRISLVNPPDWLPPDIIELMAQGSSEDLDSKTWKITFNTTPWRPYQVLRLDSGPVKKVGPVDSQLNAGINSSVTSILVKSASGLNLWTTGAVSIPITVDGEDMTVTNISGTSSPQTFTVTRGVNGYPAAHDADTPVALADRATLAM